jgi:hypothetical protein
MHLTRCLAGYDPSQQVARHHLSADAKDVVRLGMGVIATIAALVLGLLIASAKTSYDTRTTQIE